MPSPRLSPKVARLLALQLTLVPLALLALLAFVIWNIRPNHPGTTGGIDTIHAVITGIAITGIFVALGYIHLNFARQLRSEGKGTRRGVETW